MSKICDDLRASILQAAMQGKLTDQLPTDDNVDDLLANIKAERQKLIHEGKLKKQKPLPPITDADQPFSIPNTWRWVRLGEIAEFATGLGFKKNDVIKYDGETRTLRVMRGGNIGDNYDLKFMDDDTYVDFGKFEHKYIKLLPGDLLTPSVTSMQKMCKVALVDRDYCDTTAGGFVYVIRLLNKSLIVPEFLMYFWGSKINIELCKPNINKSGQAFYNLKKSGVVCQIAPLPPLAEQKRIVAKIDELMDRVNRLEKTTDALASIKSTFPSDLKSALLQAAMQGKLTDQLPTDDNVDDLLANIKAERQKLIHEGKLKKQKPLPPITDADQPFSIPNTWRWVRLGEIFETVTGKTPPKANGDYYGGEYPFYKPDNIVDGKKEVDTANEYLSEVGRGVSKQMPAGSLLVCCIGSIGKSALTKIDGTSNQQINALLPNMLVDMSFAYYACNNPVFRNALNSLSSSTTIAIVNKGKLDAMLFPLPPLAEQKRIVAKLDELLPICDKVASLSD